MAGDELDEELRPGRGVELLGVVGHRLTTHTVPQAGPAEGLIDHDSHLPLLCDRNDRVLSFARVDGVVDADEIERLALHDVHNLRVLLIEGRRHPDVADAPLLLQLFEDGQLRRHVAEVVHLNEVDLALLEAREGLIELLARSRWIGGSAAESGDVHLRRPEDLVRKAEGGGDAPRDLFRSAITRRGIENGSTSAYHRLEDLADCGDIVLACHLREGCGAAKADDRNSFTAGRDGACDEWLLRRQPGTIEGGGGARGERQGKPFAA